MSNTKWHKYQKGDGMLHAGKTYLVLLKQDQAVSMGFGSRPPILTATYNDTEGWKSLGCIIPIIDLDNLVIAWSEILGLPEDLRE